MEEYNVTISVSKKTEQMYSQAVDALGRAYEAFERASSVFMSDRSDDGSTVIQAIDLIKEARAARDRCAVVLADEIIAGYRHPIREPGTGRPQTRAERAREGAAAVKRFMSYFSTEDRAKEDKDVELKA